jgi:hypothetical protein
VRPGRAERERHRAAALAATVRDLAADLGVPLDPTLRLWTLATGLEPASDGDRVPAQGLDARPRPEPAGAEIAAAIGAGLEAATDTGRRRVQGLHVTPPWLAERLAGLALPDDAATRDATVCDPACGGGALLLAAAERLAAGGLARTEVVRERLWGADIDPVGLAAADAALALWAGEAPPAGRLVVGDPLARGAALWPARPAGGFGAVVGNPPFQSQLGRATARSAAEQRRLRARYGAAVRAYTDTAWLFLLLGCELVRPGGRVVLVEPASLVAARDAEAVRAAVDGLADLRDLWIDPGRVFAASVRVCAPVLVRRAAPAPEPPAADRWRGLWADVLGLPPAPAAAAGATLGDRARIVAGFRDEYYGLVDLVREREPDDPPGAVAPLVTTGVLDWAGSAWGRRETRFAKRRWRAPVVDLGRIDAAGPHAARRWVERTRGPKLVVASQTPVIEAAVDAAGAWVPSVPVLSVLPAGPDDLWPLAAAVLAPAATAWLARRAPGTGMERGVLRVAAPDLGALPLPVDERAWDDAAAALRALVEDGAPGARGAYLAAAAAAYRAAPAAEAWWRDRLPAESTRLGATPAG